MPRFRWQNLATNPRKHLVPLPHFSHWHTLQPLPIPRFVVSYPAFRQSTSSPFSPKYWGCAIVALPPSYFMPHINCVRKELDSPSRRRDTPIDTLGWDRVSNQYFYLQCRCISAEGPDIRNCLGCVRRDDQNLNRATKWDILVVMSKLEVSHRYRSVQFWRAGEANLPTQNITQKHQLSSLHSLISCMLSARLARRTSDNRPITSYNHSSC